MNFNSKHDFEPRRPKIYEDEFSTKNRAKNAFSNVTDSLFVKMPISWGGPIALALIAMPIALILLVFFVLPEYLLKAVIEFRDLFLLDLKNYFPENQPVYTVETARLKIQMIIDLSIVIRVLIFLFVILTVGSLHRIRYRYLSVSVGTLICVTSLYMFYEEYRLGESSFYSAIIFITTYILAFLPIVKLKKTALVGLYILVASIVGFVLSDNTLFAPFVVLALGAILLTLTRGNFWGIGRRKEVDL